MDMVSGSRVGCDAYDSGEFAGRAHCAGVTLRKIRNLRRRAAQAKSVATDAYDLVLLARAESVREPAFDGFCRFLYIMTRQPVASSSLSSLATAVRMIFREGASMEFDESCN